MCESVPTSIPCLPPGLILSTPMRCPTSPSTQLLSTSTVLRSVNPTLLLALTTPLSTRTIHYGERQGGLVTKYAWTLCVLFARNSFSPAALQ